MRPWRCVSSADTHATQKRRLSASDSDEMKAKAGKSGLVSAVARGLVSSVARRLSASDSDEMKTKAGMSTCSQSNTVSVSVLLY